MAQFSFKNQRAHKDEIEPEIQSLREQLDKRIDVWSKISLENKETWIKSDKDPIMALAWQMYKYLRDNFFGDIDDAQL